MAAMMAGRVAAVGWSGAAGVAVTCTQAGAARRASVAASVSPSPTLTAECTAIQAQKLSWSLRPAATQGAICARRAALGTVMSRCGWVSPNRVRHAPQRITAAQRFSLAGQSATPSLPWSCSKAPVQVAPSGSVSRSAPSGSTRPWGTGPCGRGNG